jgi:hypothetical protein
MLRDFCLAPVRLLIAIVWAAHIAMDRAFGYGFKYPDAFGHTHLGIVGKRDPEDISTS